MKPRYLEQAIADDLDRKMVFLGGPRQVGKTTLAWALRRRYPSSVYYNWDNPEHKAHILRQQWPPGTEYLNSHPIS